MQSITAVQFLIQPCSQKRKTDCHYSHVADLIEESNRAQDADSSPKRQKVNDTADESSPLQGLPERGQGFELSLRDSTANVHPVGPVQDGFKHTDRTPSRSSTGSTPSLLSNVPYSHPTISNLFKVEVRISFAIFIFDFKPVGRFIYSFSKICP